MESRKLPGFLDALLMEASFTEDELHQLEVINMKFIGLCWQCLGKDPAATQNETRELLSKQNKLHFCLRSHGRRPPIRLPVERQQAVQRRLVP